MGKEYKKSKVSNILSKLFTDAEKNGSRNYIYTLLRITGIVEYVKDPLLSLYDSLKQMQKGIADEEVLPRYRLIIGNAEPFSLIVNLIYCAREEAYNSSPFQHLYSGKFPNIVKPSIKQIVAETAKIAKKLDMKELSQIVLNAFPEQILDHILANDAIPDIELLKVAFKDCHALLLSLLEKYFSELRKFIEYPRLFKLPRFEVFELLVDDKSGLYGFKMHFSNGTSARFIRGINSTECINIRPGIPIEFMIGPIDELKHEWRIGKKRLYEVGLPGRYNKLGEWKPIIYPGDSDNLHNEALAMSEDRDVSGAIFYMMCTGHRVIEFVVRSSIEMPLENFSFGKNLHFYKCPSHDDIPNTYPNSFIYDGWLELDSIDPYDIRSSIAGIGVAVNRMAFAYNEQAEWCLKYRMIMNPGCYATPTKKDLHMLNKMLKEFPRTEDAVILDAAIDWYNCGMSSRNVFEAFLCYYIALESVAVTVADGHADFGLDFHKLSKKERMQKRIECIKKKHDKIYGADPTKFVLESYFDCIYSITEKVRLITEKVFGTSHDYLKALFIDKDGHSLSGIRSKIAHGEFTLIDRDVETLVRNRLPEIAEICKEFLIRVTFLLSPKETLPPWSQMFASCVLLNDPRNTLVVTRESMLPIKDWRIKPEWCG